MLPAQALSFFGAAVNVARLPERFFVVPLAARREACEPYPKGHEAVGDRRSPGAFDYWLNSHQIVRSAKPKNPP